MKHSARQLAIVLGVQPSTVTRDIKKGRVSANKNERGEYEIDASEIARAYPERIKLDDAGNIAAKPEMHGEATPTALDATPVLQAKLDAAERLLDEREQTITDLRSRLDAEGEERRRLTALLTDQREKPIPAPSPVSYDTPPAPPAKASPKGLRGWLHRLTG